MERCPKCKGNGKVIKTIPGMPKSDFDDTFVGWCDYCFGTGSVRKVFQKQIRTNCYKCGGVGRLEVVTFDRYPNGQIKQSTTRRRIIICPDCNGDRVKITYKRCLIDPEGNEHLY